MSVIATADSGRTTAALPTRVAARTFPRRPAAAPRVRRFVTKTIGRHPAVDDAELLVAELIANVILHAGDATHMSVTVAISGSLVRVDVCDNGSSGFPHVRDTDVDCDNGRGLQIVNQLALRWGFVLESGQTRFWAEVAA